MNLNIFTTVASGNHFNDHKTTHDYHQQIFKQSDFAERQFYNSSQTGTLKRCFLYKALYYSKLLIPITGTPQYLYPVVESQ